MSRNPILTSTKLPFPHSIHHLISSIAIFLSLSSFLFISLLTLNAAQPGESIAQSSPIATNGNYNSANGNHPAENGSTPVDPNGAEDTDRGRTRKKRDFFGTLKRKLGRSKSRAKSMDRGMIPIDANNPTATTTSEVRSVSADRGALGSNSSTGTILNLYTKLRIPLNENGSGLILFIVSFFFELQPPQTSTTHWFLCSSIFYSDLYMRALFPPLQPIHRKPTNNALCI